MKQYLNGSETKMNNITEDKITGLLCSLYEKYGDNRFKMNKFEQYSLYLENKDFLTSDRIVTFTDNTGRLLALKPDVTLSIVKGAVDKKSECEKVYYNENVYRASKDGEFRELTQVGVECIAHIDLYSVFEVIVLAHKSLSYISDEYLLALSHMRFISAALGGIEDAGVKKRILECISKKNVHTLKAILAENNVGAGLSECLIVLASLFGDVDTCIEKLCEISVNEETDKVLCELKRLSSLLKSAGLYAKTVMDFSIVNDMSYYNGITFQGFINGISQSVLSGGEYGKLLEKFSSKLDAVGFAVYIDALERLTAKKSFDADVFVLYSDSSDAEKLYACIDRLIASGVSVRSGRTLPGRVRCKRIMKFDGEVLTDE